MMRITRIRQTATDQGGRLCEPGITWSRRGARRAECWPPNHAEQAWCAFAPPDMIRVICSSSMY